MMKTFNVIEDSISIEEFSFPVPAQEVRAKELGVVRVFSFRNIHNVSALPQYIRTAIFNSGYEPVIVGSSTYKYTLVGLVPIK
jgi:hypothetical protein